MTLAPRATIVVGGYDPSLASEVYEQPDPKTHEIGTDKPGRSFSSVGHGHSAMEQADWHDQNEQRFLAKLAARLDKAVLGGETPSLIVVAPPRAIGVLRREFSSHVRQAIRAEVEKDYVKMPVQEITRHLMQ